MYVRNYVPDPVEVPGNVTEDRYPERLAFVRRVAALHGVSVLLIAAIAIAPLPPFATSTSVTCLGGLLLLLCLLRIGFRGARSDILFSLVLLPLLLAVCGQAASSLSRTGFPVWTACVGLACALIYTAVCGRDYSFVGQFVLSLIASSAILSTVAIVEGMDRIHAVQALAWNAGYLLFYVYDMASLLARRRRGEEFAAVVDLYRDVLNVFGWLVRVLAHWRRHKIWTLPAWWS